MKSFGVLSVFIAMSLFFYSCEKEIDVPITLGDSRLVVEGSISTDTFLFVTLTNSVGFFERIDFNNINYAKGAEVKVTDLTNNRSIALVELTIDSIIDGTNFTFTTYIPDITDPNIFDVIPGKINHAYKLDISYAGKDYTSTTIIPSNTGLDSLWLEPWPTAPDSFSILRTIYDDPDSIGNSVRYKTQRKSLVKGESENFLKSFSPNFDDEIINGTRIPFNLDMGFERNNTEIDFQRVGLVKKGDTITVQWSAIDKAVYTFWNTFEFSEGSVGNPFASPTQIQSNISNGALGVWGGYAHNYYTIIDSL